MNPKTAAKWIEAHEHCQRTKAPPVLAKVAEGKYKTALRVLMDAKPALRLPRGTKAKVKRASIPKLKKDLDRVFSLFIRQRDAGADGLGWGNGLVGCCTCPHIAHWKEMDCGHYCPRQDLATRWDERNCHIQDKACNGFRGGEPEKMAKYIDAKYGAGTAESLRAQARQPFKLNRQWLEAKIAHYKNLVKE